MAGLPTANVFASSAAAFAPSTAWRLHEVEQERALSPAFDAGYDAVIWASALDRSDGQLDDRLEITNAGIRGALPLTTRKLVRVLGFVAGQIDALQPLARGRARRWRCCG